MSHSHTLSKDTTNFGTLYLDTLLDTLYLDTFCLDSLYLDTLCLDIRYLHTLYLDTLYYLHTFYLGHIYWVSIYLGTLEAFNIHRHFTLLNMCWDCDRLGINQPYVCVVGEYAHFPRSQLTLKNAAQVAPTAYVPTERDRLELSNAIPGFQFEDDGSNTLYVFAADLEIAPPLPAESARRARQSHRRMHRTVNHQTQGVVSTPSTHIHHPLLSTTHH